MRQMGAPEEVIEKYRAQQESASIEEPIGVHPDNWDVVRVFRLCTFPTVSGFGGVALAQLPTVEIVASASAADVDATEYVVHAVKIMGAEYANVKNQAAADEVARQRGRR